jgi:soluble lytic murein transglycosylase-like protein
VTRRFDMSRLSGSAALAGAAALLAVAAVVLAVALGDLGGSGEPTSTAADPAGKGGEPPGGRLETGGIPDPDALVPRRPARLAAALTEATTGLRAAIERWRDDGDPARGGPPREVTLLGLYQQRIYLVLGTRPRLARSTLALLRGGVRAEARDVLVVRRALGRLNPPTRRVRFRIGRALPADVLRRLYKRAERRFGVDWRLLAAVNLVETGFNRIRSNSSAGAQGPMQFIPSTWAAYGLGGDIRDPADAIMGAANYLRASSAPGDERDALFAYNPSTDYVNSVRAHARSMRRDVRTYYGLYSWQIFVRTPSGSRQLTGPGRDFVPRG